MIDIKLIPVTSSLQNAKNGDTVDAVNVRTIPTTATRKRVDVYGGKLGGKSIGYIERLGTSNKSWCFFNDFGVYGSSYTRQSAIRGLVDWAWNNSDKF